MSGKIFRLDKAVLSARNNSVNFLNGISANTIDKPKNVFLDMYGKIIATFDQLKVNDDLVFVIIESKYYEPLMQHLDRYIRLSKAQVTKEDYCVYYDLDNSFVRAVHEPPLLEGDIFVIPQRVGQLIATKQDLPNSVSDEEFTLFRLKNCLPMHGVDYQAEMILNVAEEEFVSFTKGCFLGQEPVSKVHNRSKPTWKLAVKFEDECSEEEKIKMTSQIKDPQTGKFLGFVFVSNR